MQHQLRRFAQRRLLLADAMSGHPTGHLAREGDQQQDIGDHGWVKRVMPQATAHNCLATTMAKAVPSTTSHQGANGGNATASSAAVSRALLSAR